MAIVNAKCTSCGAAIQLNNERKEVFCSFCGKKVLAEEASNNSNARLFQRKDAIQEEKRLAGRRISEQTQNSLNRHLAQRSTRRSVIRQLTAQLIERGQTRRIKKRTIIKIENSRIRLSKLAEDDYQK